MPVARIKGRTRAVGFGIPKAAKVDVGVGIAEHPAVFDIALHKVCPHQEARLIGRGPRPCSIRICRAPRGKVPHPERATPAGCRRGISAACQAIAQAVQCRLAHHACVGQSHPPFSTVQLARKLPQLCVQGVRLRVKRGEGRRIKPTVHRRIKGRSRSAGVRGQGGTPQCHQRVRIKPQKNRCGVVCERRGVATRDRDTIKSPRPTVGRNQDILLPKGQGLSRGHDQIPRNRGRTCGQDQRVRRALRHAHRQPRAVCKGQRPVQRQRSVARFAKVATAQTETVQREITTAGVGIDLFPAIQCTRPATAYVQRIGSIATIYERA